ncbi:MAG: argininosuccinate lyase [Alphaproteobacteria bacterium]|nr:argininosuccinate lyase [Alphaproteobacteria bacterium]MDE1986280.1 argininosuccinate lyase [Alphaproteobacteria bacterium]MDE2162714.1 argininosuccinate lyase [Alphaproteobacteria bacterium]MDE2500806.1 argininosuccinate lyase [Alphaproteobacteria bacterium]
MWGGRFEGGPAKIMEEITPSIDFDKRLADQDLAGSRAHARMLATQGIIAKDDAEAILRGLDAIGREITDGKFVFRRALEDIHLNIEARLAEIVGPVAGRLHTARSRNDQVVTDFRLWIREACDRAEQALKALQGALLGQAEGHTATVMPGFTHMQSAQPITFAHHCLAYVEMFARDAGRFADARKRLNECPLGAAALAGTSFPIDRDVTAKALGFARPMRNSLDAVSARDFALEYLAAATIAATHLSRLAGELVQWCSPGFGFVRLSDAFTTGSSIMPQKRNPDAAELIRGKTGRVLGDFVSLTTVVKGLVLAYGSDLQEDKERVFDAADTLELSLAAMAAMITDLKANPEIMRAAATAGYPTATDLADWLVRVLKKPFREAHHIAGSIVKRAEDLKIDLDKLPLAEMQKIEPAITLDVIAVLSLDASVASRMSYGGTAPHRVREQIVFWREKLK